jgi:hypothetical protein
MIVWPPTLSPSARKDGAPSVVGRIKDAPPAGLRFVVSPVSKSRPGAPIFYGRIEFVSPRPWPPADKAAKGWGTLSGWADQGCVARRVRVRGLPGLKIETGGTHLLWEN